MNDSKPTAGTPAPQAPVPIDPQHAPSPVDLAQESVAGEEDPGAALEDIVAPPVTPRKDGG